MDTENKIVVLSGGVGGARFLEGLVQVVDQKDIFVIANTGDDKEFYGLQVSPDVDIVIYTLSGQVNQNQGWGVIDETYTTMNQLTFLGNENWFMLGDKDLATHIHRTNLLKHGQTPAEVTQDLTKRFGLSLQIVPMTNASVQTYIQTSDSVVHFEEYFVKYQAQLEIQDIIYKSIEQATPAPGILEAISKAKGIIIAPSNPLVSIGTILAIPGIRDALKQTPATVVAISPLVGGKTIKGPADKMLAAKGVEVTSRGIATFYSDIVDGIVIDNQDKEFVDDIKKLGIEVVATDTVMKNSAIKKQLAKTVVDLF